MMNKIMKKVTIAIAAAAMMITAASTSVMANDGMGMETMDVSVQDLDAIMYVVPECGANVRTAPSTENSRILKTFAYNTAVKVDGYTSNGWFRVFTSDPVFGGMTSGYISGSLLSSTKGAEYTDPANLPDEYFVKTGSNSRIGYKKSYKVNVESGYLALRNAQKFDYSNEIAQLANGTKVELINEMGEGTYWSVYVPSLRMSGYVNSNYLK